MAEPIGSRIRAAREHYGMSQAELGRRIGITRQQMHSIERNRQLPKSDQVSAIARVLGVDGNYLLGLGERNRPKRVPGGASTWPATSLLQAR